MPHVRIYYALEALGKTNELHSKVFEAIQVKKMPLLKPDEIADLRAVLGRRAHQSCWPGMACIQGRWHAVDGGRRQVHDFAVDGWLT